MKLIPGFFFRETMRGSYYRLKGPAKEHPIDLAIRAKTEDVRRFARDKTWTVDGRIDADGLAVNAPVEGTLAIRLEERRLTYRYHFRGIDTQTYELCGQKEWTPISPFESLTLLPASIYDAKGAEVARANLRFDARNEFGTLIKSFRIVFS